MIVFYGHGCPNPHKVAIALEELGLPYEARVVDVWAGGPFPPEVAAHNPNGKVPVILDTDTGQVVYESNAILLYLADKAGRLFPAQGPERWEAMQLLFLQAASVGPMFGRRAHFSLFAPEKPAYVVARYRQEGKRITRVLDGLLRDRDHFLAGHGFSIVDIAFFGWLWCSTRQGFALGGHPNLQRWFDRVAARPAVRRGVEIPLPLPDFGAARAAAAA
jgi:GSH-dependent disulfide-bond oxidoreductase